MNEVGEQRAVPSENPSENYREWTTSWLIRKIVFEKSVPSARISFWVFVVYWITPLLLATVSGTVFSREKLQELARLLETNLPDLLPIPKLLTGLADLQALANVTDITYLSDKTHFAFAVIIAIGSGLAAHVVRNFHLTVSKLRDADIPVADEAEIVLLYNRYRNLATHFFVRLLSLCLGLFTFVVFYYISNASGNENWWGHARYGYTGVVFAAIEALMVYWGTRVLVLIGLGSLMLVKVMRFPLILRPFHSDGCNGLSALGQQIIYLWLFSLSLAFAVYVTLSFGYLGIEKMLITWVLAVLCTLVIPAIAVLPLLSALKSIHEARRARLGNYEKLLDSLLQRAESATVEGDSEKAIKIIASLRDIQTAQNIINTANVWPFNPRALFSILLVNVVQIVLTADELFGVFG